MGWIASVASLVALGCTAPAAVDGEALPVCSGKCDAIDGGMSSLPVAVQSISWDGYVVLGAREDGSDCRAMAVRPERIAISATAVDFPPAAFSTGIECSAPLGAHAIVPALGVQQNPFASDASGEAEDGGDHLTYDLLVYEGAGSQIAVRDARVVIADPHTDAAEVVQFELGESRPLSGPLVGSAPTLTVDGGLMIFQGHPDNDGRTDTLVYSRRIGDDPAAGWTAPRSITQLYDERDEMVDGVSIAERYPIAAQRLRVPDGRMFPSGFLYFGQYPWIARDGSELFHTATLAGPEENGVRGRHGAMSVIGRATGYAIRHIDGPLNPSREGLADAVTLRRFQTSPGQAPGFWTPFAASGRSIPLDRDGLVMPVFGTVSDGEQLIGSYNEVSFAAFADRDYLLYLAMNESLAPVSTGEVFYDATQTPDISGGYAMGRLENGARFAVEQFGADSDENTGAFGRAIYFSERGQVRLPASAELNGDDAVLTVQAWVQRLENLATDSNDRARWLVQWPGVAELVLHEDGRIESTVFAGGQPQRSGAVGPALALDTWTHVAFTWHGPSGTLRTFIDGQERGEIAFAPARTGAATGELLLGPAGRGEGLVAPEGTAVVALDEVAISRVVRSDEEIARAAGRPIDDTPELANQSLLALVDLPLGLDRDALLVPAANPVDEDAIELGRLLFFDPRLSRDGTISCASCHDPAHAWTDARSTGLGIEGRIGGRNTPTIFNRALSTRQFWDGRAGTVEMQAVGPIVSFMEMDNTEAATLAFLESVPEYVQRFQDVYGSAPTADTIERAIASFERAQLTGNTPADRYEAGETTALTAAQIRGRELFHGRGRCSSCHTGTNLTDESFHATGLVTQVGTDLGRFTASGRMRDLFAYKTPSLRNVALTGPYFHDGSVATLADAVRRYSDGSPVPEHDWEIRPLQLSADEQADLVAFLEALTDPDATSATAPELPGMD